MIGVLHAYSRTNSGDGLLVDLTLERLARGGIPRDDVLLVALDPDSFAEIPHRTGAGVPGRGIAWELVPAAGRGAALAASALSGRPVGGLATALSACDALVAVGGGYLRAVDATSSLGALLNHLPQLVAAGHSGVPSLYLPQSIGPLRGPVGAAVRRALAHVDVVCVRDRWSAEDLRSLDNVHPIPDLAVLELAESIEEIKPVERGGQIGFVARRVGHAPGYDDEVRAVAESLGDRATWAVQTEGDATKSDAVHYQHLGVEAGGALVDMLAAHDLSVVVSVRLHGALMALRAGVPAIHLAYDRKGPAAFADLGLEDWCIDVRSVSRTVLADAVERLAADPEPYWQRVRARTEALTVTSRRLDELIRSVLPT